MESGHFALVERYVALSWADLELHGVPMALLAVHVLQALEALVHRLHLTFELGFVQQLQSWNVSVVVSMTS